ncbi:hypothetical protein GCM10011514_16590 [Emticicia aquatilis]|uniref:Uncharacterized protein n=1 Tax=Emticicia aquatilis TaxID=1537369 RepID=A0A916YML6_9BACT|nr:hypothetical protein [Emticicia aquatilis]GGD53153.1 hypothetical protein GCM10011514_16590 [Emticicia aquatilis]
MRTFTLISVVMLSLLLNTLHGQGSYLTQDFSSSTNLNSYVSASPDSGQFTYIRPNFANIINGKLVFKPNSDYQSGISNSSIEKDISLPVGLNLFSLEFDLDFSSGVLPNPRRQTVQPKIGEASFGTFEVSNGILEYNGFRFYSNGLRIRILINNTSDTIIITNPLGEPQAIYPKKYEVWGDTQRLVYNVTLGNIFPIYSPLGLFISIFGDGINSYLAFDNFSIKPLQVYSSTANTLCDCPSMSTNPPIANVSGLRLKKLTSASPASVVTTKFVTVNDKGELILGTIPVTLSAILSETESLKRQLLEKDRRINDLESQMKKNLQETESLKKLILSSKTRLR